MIAKTVIELSKQDLEKILCEYFNFQLPKAQLIIREIKGMSALESDYTEIKLEVLTTLNNTQKQH